MSYKVVRSRVRLEVTANYKGCRIEVDQRRFDGGWTRVVDYLVPPTDRKSGLEMARFFGGSDERALQLTVNNSTILELSYDENKDPTPYELSWQDRSGHIKLRTEEVFTICHIADEYFDGGRTFDTYADGEEEDDLSLPSTIVNVGAVITEDDWLTLARSLNVVIEPINSDMLQVSSVKSEVANQVVEWLHVHGYEEARAI